MKLQPTHPTLEHNFTLYSSYVIKLSLNVLIMILVVAIAYGVARTGIALVHDFRRPLEIVLKDVLLNVISTIALVEIVITILAYLEEGRVRVTYVIDAVLIVMLNELISMWFNKPALMQVAGMALLIGTLMGARILTIVFSPMRERS